MTTLEKYNKGTKYLDRNRPDKAIPLFKAQLKEFEFKECWLNLGNSYRLQNKDDLAKEAYLKSNMVDMPSSEGKFGTYDLALNNLGLLAFKHGNNETAIQFYRACLEKNALHYDAIWNHAIALLRKGCSGEDIDWALAWRMYEYRFKKMNPVRVTPGVLAWDGISKVNKLLVLAEQGQGDKIMFGRYVSRLQEFANSVIVECPPGMESLFTFGNVVGIEGRYEGSDAVGVPICSLAARFGINSSAWLAGRFGTKDLDGDFKIGIVWSGSTTHANNYNRSCPPGYFKGLSRFGKLYNINPDSVDVPFAEKLCGRDWAETAEIINGLDLVVSVDTSIVHMAGSLGVPCFMIQPRFETDFRWGLNRSDCIWYPSLRVFENNGWDKVMVNVEKAVEELKNAKNS